MLNSLGREIALGKIITIMSAGAGAIFSTAGNMLTSTINNMWASQMASEDRAENYKYGEMAANAADRRTRALYNDFYSPQALLRQYQQAGLSPSLMFGGTPGQGGASGAQGSGAAGIQTHFMPMSLVDAAQAAALFAQAEKTKEETTTEKETREPTIENIYAQTAEHLASAGEKEASTEVIKLQGQAAELELQFQNETYWNRVELVNQDLEKLRQETNKLYEETRSLRVHAEVDEETKNSQIKTIRRQAQLLAQQVLDSKEGRKLTAKQATYFKQLTEQAAYKMQLDGWYAEKYDQHFSFEINQEKWNRAFQEWAKENEFELQKAGIETEQWATKWKIMGGLIQSAMVAMGLGKGKTITNEIPQGRTAAPTYGY